MPAAEADAGAHLDRALGGARLAALQRTGLLDSDPELAFDRYARLAARVIGVPVALVSLVDDRRQFFKACVGLPEPWATSRETPLSHSFCQYVVLSSEPLVVEDAREHPILRANGAVADLGVIAYAGYPIIDVDGHVLGSFCAIDGEPRAWAPEELSVLEDLAAAVSGVVQLRMALAEAAQAQQRLSVLAEAGAELSRSLDYRATLQSVADIAVRSVADLCSVIVRADNGELERVATAAAGPMIGRVDSLRQAPAPSAFAGATVPEVMRTGRSLLVDVTPEFIRSNASSPEQERGYADLGLSSAIFVPLAGTKSTSGVLFLGSASPLSSQDLRLAEELGRRAGSAIENAALYQREHAVATELQRSLLPPSLPSIDYVELASYYRPAHDSAEVGGDFYDVFAIGSDRWGVAIGDVCGKGSAAAALTGLVRYSLRTAAILNERPGDALGAVNRTLAEEIDDDRFCTAAFAAVRRTVDGATLTVANAGHPVARVVRASGAVERLPGGDLLLGVTTEAVFGETEVSLRSGDTIVLVTDGVLEARDATGELFGGKRLDAVLSSHAHRRPEDAVSAIVAAVEAHLHGRSRDDIAIVALSAR